MKKYVCNSNIFIYFCAQFESKQHQLVDNLIAKHPKSNTFREHPQGNRTWYTDTFHAKQAYSIYIPIARKYFNSQEYSHQSMNITEKNLHAQHDVSGPGVIKVFEKLEKQGIDVSRQN